MVSCQSDESEISIALRTDNYAYKTQWEVVNTNNNDIIASGPPPGTKYDDLMSYW